jgi:alkanesulfonate monooxygenase
MTVEFVGGLFPENQLAPRSAYAGAPDLKFLRDLAQAHERAGFDRVLIANGGGEPQHLAAYAAAHTERLGFMLAHRPALMSPPLAARYYATLDHTTRGRIRLHCVTGHTADVEHGDTLFDKEQRYERAGEYLDIVRRTWTSSEPFDYEGKYFKVQGAFSPIKPVQTPHVPISVGGTSDGAYRLAVQHADLYALWAEPLADIAERIAKLRRFAAEANKPAPRVSLSARLIIGRTDEIAWERAHEIVAALKRNQALSTIRRRGTSGGAQRQIEINGRGDRFDRALYMGTSEAIGFDTDSVSLVGSPETIIASLLDYYDLGVTTFLTRGYYPLYDAVEYGRYIISAVREEVKKRELSRAQSQALSAE